MQSLWRRVQSFLKKLKIELLCDPAISLLSIYPEKNVIRKHTCNPVFITLFIIAKALEQSIYLFMDEYKGMLLSYKNEWDNAIYINMDGPRDLY